MLAVPPTSSFASRVLAVALSRWRLWFRHPSAGRPFLGGEGNPRRGRRRRCRGSGALRRGAIEGEFHDIEVAVANGRRPRDARRNCE